MPFGEKGGNDDVEALVDTLTIEGGALTEGNLSTLTSTDIQQLAELSNELHLTNDIDGDGDVIIETIDESQNMEGEVVQAELGAHEVEIETERATSPEEILPDVKCKTTIATTTIPPLRPLTIAPKPAKIPIAMKPVPGQQLVLLQGTGSGQTIKLVSSQGQELNLSNISIGRPVTIKPAMKTVTPQTGVTLVQPKQVVMKKIVTQKGGTKVIQGSRVGKQGHIMVVQKSEQVKLLPATPTNTLPSPTKTITLQQAQEMGFITTTKILQPQGHSTPKTGGATVVLSKPTTPTGQKTIKIVPQIVPATGAAQFKVTGNKNPTKILPAVTKTATAGQRIILKAAGGSGHTILPSAQIIQVAGTQALSTGQLHQINIPGKGMQYIKFVTTSNAETIPTATTLTTVKTETSGSNLVLGELKPTSAANIAPKPLKTIAAKTTLPVSATQQVVVLPSYVHSSQLNTKVAIPMRHTPATKQIPPEPSATVTQENLESNGMRPRKPCNCTKSQCLKLYCDCFANGEFCYMCNCMNCYNNLENEEHRQRAIRTCLERNPNAFRPKIGKAKDVSGDTSIRKHTKGCNCKRSGCLKNYCECYEAKIACSNNCKCIGCRNIEDSMEKKSLIGRMEEGGTTVGHTYTSKGVGNKEGPLRQRRSSTSRQAINFITEDVIEATAQCMLTISDSGEIHMQDEELTKKQIIEEFGRCLKEIIDYSSLHN